MHLAKVGTCVYPTPMRDKPLKAAWSDRVVDGDTWNDTCDSATFNFHDTSATSLPPPSNPTIDNEPRPLEKYGETHQHAPLRPRGQHILAVAKLILDYRQMNIVRTMARTIAWWEVGKGQGISNRRREQVLAETGPNMRVLFWACWETSLGSLTIIHRPPLAPH